MEVIGSQVWTGNEGKECKDRGNGTPGQEVSVRIIAGIRTVSWDHRAEELHTKGSLV